MNHDESSDLRGVLVVLAVCASASAAAQTSDDFFNPEVLQRVELWMQRRRLGEAQGGLPGEHLLSRRHDVERHDRPQRRHPLARSRLAQQPPSRACASISIATTSGQQFLGLKSFVLDNLTQDHTGIKETVAMRFFTRLGIPRAARNAHAPVRERRLHGALRPGRIRRQDDDGPRLRQHRRQRPERRLPVRIQLRDRQPVAIHLRRLGRWRPTRRASTSRPTRATPSR